MDADERFTRLEHQMLEVLQEQARRSESNTQLKESVDALRGDVTSLKSTIDKGRGAMWVLGGLGAAVGAFGSMLANKFLGG